MQGKADDLSRCHDQKVFQRRCAKRPRFEKWGDRRGDCNQSDSCFYLAAISGFVQTADRLLQLVLAGAVVTAFRDAAVWEGQNRLENFFERLGQIDFDLFHDD